MSKSSRDTLFGITLTELIIIVFFIMLLLAIFNIDDLTKKIPTGEDAAVPAAPIIKALIPDGKITSDLIPADLIAEEIKKLKEAEKELQKYKQTEKKIAEENNGRGDCKGGFWITPKCADHCWAINNTQGSRQYDYLLDIGVCESFVLVQRSSWISKTEADFQQVPGTREITRKLKISKGELYTFLDTIKEPGYTKEPKQCYHSVNLVDLGSTSIDSWTNNLKQVNSRVSPFVLTKNNGALYETLRKRFPKDACANVNKSKTTEKNITKPKINFEDFNDSLINDRRCRNISSGKFTLDFLLTISKLGQVIEIDYLGNEKSLNRPKKRLLDITKDALIATSFTPATKGEENVNFIHRQSVTLSRGVCR